MGRKAREERTSGKYSVCHIHRFTLAVLYELYYYRVMKGRKE